MKPSTKDFKAKVNQMKKGRSEGKRKAEVGSESSVAPSAKVPRLEVPPASPLSSQVALIPPPSSSKVAQTSLP